MTAVRAGSPNELEHARREPARAGGRARNERGAHGMGAGLPQPDELRLVRRPHRAGPRAARGDRLDGRRGDRRRPDVPPLLPHDRRRTRADGQRLRADRLRRAHRRPLLARRADRGPRGGGAAAAAAGAAPACGSSGRGAGRSTSRPTICRSSAPSPARGSTTAPATRDTASGPSWLGGQILASLAARCRRRVDAAAARDARDVPRLPPGAVAPGSAAASCAGRSWPARRPRRRDAARRSPRGPEPLCRGCSDSSSAPARRREYARPVEVLHLRRRAARRAPERARGAAAGDARGARRPARGGRAAPDRGRELRPRRPRAADGRRGGRRRAAVRRREGVELSGLVLNERGWERFAAAGLDRVNVTFAATETLQPAERERDARRGRRADRGDPRGSGRDAGDRDDLRARSAVRSRGASIRASWPSSRRGSSDRAEVVLADTIGVATPSAVALARRAGAGRRLPRPQHAQHRLRELPRRARGRGARPRRFRRRPRRLSVLAARDGQRRDRGSRLPARGRRRRDRRRPRRARRRLAVARGRARPHARGLRLPRRHLAAGVRRVPWEICGRCWC